jgi:hypothetical protein
VLFVVHNPAVGRVIDIQEVTALSYARFYVNIGGTDVYKQKCITEF